MTITSSMPDATDEIEPAIPSYVEAFEQVAGTIDGDALIEIPAGA